MSTSRRIERALDRLRFYMAFLVGLLWNLILQKSVPDPGCQNERRFIESVQQKSKHP